jgi:N-methylhydantoinase A
MTFRIFVDTGGTFTDVVVLTPDGQLPIGKALTTYERIVCGMGAALAVVAADLGLPLATLLGEASTLIYGTTHATNAVVTKRTARTAFLTTMGLRHTLTLKEGGKPGPRDYTIDDREPYILRRRSLEIAERIGADGEVVRPLDGHRHDPSSRRCGSATSRRSLSPSPGRSPTPHTSLPSPPCWRR